MRGGVPEIAETIDYGGWVIPEAGAMPARPRHCERPDRSSERTSEQATGGTTPGKADEAASSQET